MSLTNDAGRKEDSGEGLVIEAWKPQLLWKKEITRRKQQKSRCPIRSDIVSSRNVQFPHQPSPIHSPFTPHSLPIHSPLTPHSLLTQSPFTPHSLLIHSSLSPHSLPTHSSFTPHSLLIHSSFTPHSLPTHSSFPSVSPIFTKQSH